jgi:signal transduction histidine kinase
MLVEATRPGAGDEDTEKEYLLERATWLVQMRWFAVGGVLAAAAAAWATRFVEPLLLASVGAALAAWNVFSRVRLDRRGTASVEVLRRLVFEQLLGDMAALALLLELSGGAENPFAMLFALPAAIGAMLLTTRSAVALAAIGCSFQALVVFGQFAGLLPHHGLHAAFGHPATIVSPLYRSWRYLAGYLTAFAVMMGAVVYFVRSVTLRYQRAEALRREHDRVAQSREKLARIGELSAGIAHAVRNPLHGLSSSVELLQHKLAGDDRVEGNLEMMADALKRIEIMTRRLLSLGRDEPLSRLPCDVDALVADTVKLASPSTRRSQARLETDLGDIGKVEIDPARFGEALINLVDNALDACREGGVVTVKTRAGPGTAGPIVVEVTDTGPGIRADVARKVFDPFFTTKPVGEGTGLGLAISRRVVEEHGGEMTLESEPGRGTRVSMTLPRAAAGRAAP